MANDILNIDNYFQGNLSAEEREDFENKLANDPSLAADVAFYAHSKLVHREQILNERHAEWTSLKKTNTKVVDWRVIVPIAALLVLALGWLFLFDSKQTPEQMANYYFKQNYEKLLSVNMSGSTESLEKGKQLAKDGKYQEAEKIFVTLIKKDSTNFKAKKLAGVVCVKAGNYDKAANYFHLLGNQTGLYQNPGYFYEALALLQTNEPNNKNRAKKLLETVISQNLEGKSEAEKIVDSW
jgi:hypothetical protein